MDATSTVEPSNRPGRCAMCHRILPPEIEPGGALEPISVCGDCKFLFLENTQPTVDNARSTTFMTFPNFDSVLTDAGIFYGEDSDASVDVSGSFLNSDTDDDDEFEEIETDENRQRTLVGRVQLRRSLATNGRNLSYDWLSEILSSETDVRINGGDYLNGRGFEELVDRPAAVLFLKSLERVVVDEELVCVICKDNVCVGSVVNRLPCGHVYHPLCIVPWLSARNTCPLCRYEVPTDDKDVVDEGGGGGGRRWWFVAAPVVAIGLVLWFGGGVFGGSWASQRDDRSSRRWWCLL